MLFRSVQLLDGRIINYRASVSDEIVARGDGRYVDEPTEPVAETATATEDAPPATDEPTEPTEPVAETATASRPATTRRRR